MKSAKHVTRHSHHHFWWCMCDKPDEQPVGGVFGALGAKRCVRCERPTYEHLRGMS